MLYCVKQFRNRYISNSISRHDNATANLVSIENIEKETWNCRLQREINLLDLGLDVVHSIWYVFVFVCMFSCLLKVNAVRCSVIEQMHRCRYNEWKTERRERHNANECNQSVVAKAIYSSRKRKSRKWCFPRQNKNSINKQITLATN